MATPTPSINTVAAVAAASSTDIPLLDSYSASVYQAVERINYYGPYGYKPTLGGAVAFTIVFGLCTLFLTYRGIRDKVPWLLSTLAFGALAETVGNAVRIYGHFHPGVVNPYIGQQVILVLTPAFFAAAHFTVLTKICEVLDDGKLVHPLKVRWLIPFFVTLDIVSLAIQGAGSGLAASNESEGKSVDEINKYGKVVVGGLALQLFGYLAFDALFLRVCWRLSRRSRPKFEKDAIGGIPKHLETLLAATFISATFVSGRSAFRLAEMSIGWIGRVATVEWYYLTFDATFVACALITLIFVSPSRHIEILRDTVSDRPSSLPDGEATA